MAEPGTKDVLLRLRRVRELELRRELSVKRAARADARRRLQLAEASRRELDRRIRELAHRALGGWATPRIAGRLAEAERYVRGLREALANARVTERKLTARLDEADRALGATQRGLGEAVLGRQRSEAIAATERALDARARERREHAETEDRYRKPGPRPRLTRDGANRRGF